VIGMIYSINVITVIDVSPEMIITYNSILIMYVALKKEKKGRKGGRTTQAKTYYYLAFFNAASALRNPEP
jgi:hypothetical protein